MVSQLQQTTSNETERAELRNALASESTSFDQAYAHVINFLADIGVRGNIVENEAELNDALVHQQTLTLAEIRDADLTEVVSQYNQELTILQLSQQSFLRVQESSIMNLI